MRIVLRVGLNTKMSERETHDTRYVTINGIRYLHQDDVASYIRKLGSTEETDVRLHLEKAADNLMKVG